MSLNTAVAYRLLWLQAMYLVLRNRWLLKVDSAGTVQRSILPSTQGRLPNGPEDWRQVMLTGHAAATAGSWVVDRRRPCLPVALATQILLARQGFQAVLRIGVQRSEGAIEGHAWVECAGRCIVGKPAPGIVALQPPNHLDP
jgi:hypothetical protein